MRVCVGEDDMLLPEETYYMMLEETDHLVRQKDKVSSTKMELDCTLWA